MKISERKAQDIYDAVHEVLMRLRIDIAKRGDNIRAHEIENTLATTQHAAAMAAVAAYKKPLKALR